MCLGALHDFPTADEGASFEQGVRHGIQQVRDSGRLDIELEFVHATCVGLPLPGGSARVVEEAFRNLVGRGAVAILARRSRTTRWSCGLLPTQLAFRR